MPSPSSSASVVSGVPYLSVSLCTATSTVFVIIVPPSVTTFTGTLITLVSSGLPSSLVPQSFTVGVPVISPVVSSYFETIELKSTKQDSIPGSSIQQILPDEWVIFIKHTAKDVDVVTGKYRHSINSKMQFPDRSPRPQVSFKKLKNWNDNFRNFEKNVLTYSLDENLMRNLN